jgi:hypothetical protein
MYCDSCGKEIQRSDKERIFASINIRDYEIHGPKRKHLSGDFDSVHCLTNKLLEKGFRATRE